MKSFYPPVVDLIIFFWFCNLSCLTGCKQYEVCLVICFSVGIFADYFVFVINSDNCVIHGFMDWISVLFTSSEAVHHLVMQLFI